MSLSGLPFDDIRALIAQVPEGDHIAGQLANTRAGDLAQGFGLQGKHASLAEWLAVWSGKSPNVSRPMLALFAGNHAIAERANRANGETTLETVTRLAAGGGSANQACASFDIGLKVFDLALQFPVADIGHEDALDEKGAAATIGFGMEAIAGGVDLLGLAAFGKGSEIANMAFFALLVGQEIGAGNALVQEIVERHQSAVADPLELLRRIGGREHSAMAGAILAARVNHVPVVLEGTTAAAIVLLLQKMDAKLCDHCCFAGLPGQEVQGSIYRAAITQSGLQTVLDGFGIAYDGANAALAIGIMKSIANLHRDSVLEAS